MRVNNYDMLAEAWERAMTSVLVVLNEGSKGLEPLVVAVAADADVPCGIAKNAVWGHLIEGRICYSSEDATDLCLSVV